jgi:uncharacterized protein YbaP (TraB family)
MRKLLVLAFACLPLAAAAQPGPETVSVPPPVPEWAQIETVESNAIPGPALWHVTKDNSEVWILGMIGNLPKGITWNSESLSDVIKGSRAVVTGPSASLGVGGVLSAGWLMITNCCSPFRLDEGKLDDFLSGPARVKLTAMRESVGGDAKLYQGDEPFRAAMRLSADFAVKHDLRGEDPIRAVMKLTDAQDLKREPAFQFDPLPIIREALKLKPQQQLPCLEAEMEDIDRRVLHARTMAEAWTVGDIKGVKEHFAESRSLECLTAAVRTFGMVQQNRVPAYVAAIAAALDKPGKTFAVVDMGSLLRKDGVLERLEKRGLTIEGPRE